VRGGGIVLCFLPYCVNQALNVHHATGPVLQKLSHPAAFAMVVLKYAISSMALSEADLGQVLTCLEEAAASGVKADTQSTPPSSDATWSTRGAALSVAQYWWFRSCPLLPHLLATRLQAMVTARLADPRVSCVLGGGLVVACGCTSTLKCTMLVTTTTPLQPEVRVVAGATLSGLLRGMTSGDAEALRSSLLARAARALSTSAIKSATVAGAGGSLLLERHAVVQGLAACLASSPYDCPAWMRGVIMALVRPAAALTARHGGDGGRTGLEASVRTAAAKV
jgi:hypothetical protein